MLVENNLDELRIGVKCQSNVEIAGSPRNSSRASLGGSRVEVGRWMGSGAQSAYQPHSNHKCRVRATPGVRRWGLSFIVKRETAQTTG